MKVKNRDEYDFRREYKTLCSQMYYVHQNSTRVLCQNEVQLLDFIMTTRVGGAMMRNQFIYLITDAIRHDGKARMGERISLGRD